MTQTMDNIYDLKRLAVTTRGGGRAREEEYGDFHRARGVRLRAKYRRPQLTQFGCGADITGKAHRRKLSTKDKAKLQPQPEVVMVVSSNGRARFIRTGRTIPAGSHWATLAPLTAAEKEQIRWTRVKARAA